MTKANKKLIEEYVWCAFYAGAKVLGIAGTIHDCIFGNYNKAVLQAFVTGANIVHYNRRKKRLDMLLSQLDTDDITYVIFSEN